MLFLIMAYDYMDLSLKRVGRHFYHPFYAKRKNVYKFNGVYIDMAYVLFTREKQADVSEFPFKSPNSMSRRD